MTELIEIINRIKEGKIRIKKNGNGYFELVSLNKNYELILLLHRQLFIDNRQPNFKTISFLQKNTDVIVFPTEEDMDGVWSMKINGKGEFIF